MTIFVNNFAKCRLSTDNIVNKHVDKCVDNGVDKENDAVWKEDTSMFIPVMARARRQRLSAWH